MSPKVCIVGAGAVGLVYAQHLRKAGAEVALLVKPQHADVSRKGFALHRLGFRGRCHSEQLDDLAVLVDLAEVAAQRFEQIWLTVASDSMRSEWLGELLAGAGDATVVILQPDLEDRSLVLEHIDEEHLVHGLIGFLSFQSPMPGAEGLPAGIVYSLLPAMASSFDGARAPEVVRLLKKGGFPARRMSDLPGSSAERSATTVPLIAGLEVAGWSIDAFARSPWLAHSIAASKEALAVVAIQLGRRPTNIRHLLQPWPVGATLKLVRPLSPFDLEAYLRFHFTKVGPQTRLMLETYARLAEDAKSSNSALRALREAL